MKKDYYAWNEGWPDDSLAPSDNEWVDFDDDIDYYDDRDRTVEEGGSVDALTKQLGQLTYKMERLTPDQKKNLMQYFANVSCMVNTAIDFNKVLDRACRDQIIPVF